MFQGFSPETMDFLWGIRLNNNRDWFMAHKEEYQKFLYEPMKLLSQKVFAAFQDIPNMDHKLSRIYKDARLHPAVPYKESLWLSMRPENRPWSEQPTLYFEIEPEGCNFGSVLWMPKREKLELFRQMLTARPTEFPQLVADLESASGLKFCGDAYYRKKPCPDPVLEPYFNLKNLQFVGTVQPGELLFSGELADVVIETLRALVPFYEYCLQFTM